MLVAAIPFPLRPAAAHAVESAHAPARHCGGSAALARALRGRGTARALVWEPMRVVRESLEVKGEAPREIEMRFTRHGPVLAQDAAGQRAFAMRSIWFEPGTSAYFGSSDYMTAKDWKGFSDAMTRWGAPSENQAYADTSGNIGWIPAGTTPIRD